MRVSRFCAASLAATLLAGTAAQTANACTGIELHDTDGSVVNGRTVEFGIQIDNSVVVVPRKQAFVGQTPIGDGMHYTAKYGVVGVIAFKDVKILDGLNEAGLAAGAFYFPTFAHYTPATAANRSKALSPSDFTNWLLTQFATVDEVRHAVESGQAVIAPTVIAGWGAAPPPFHYVVYDKSGKSIVIEPIDGKLVVSDNPLGVITNSPSFDWHMTNLRNYIALDPRNVPDIKIADQTFKQLGQGNGMLGLPGDFSPPSRLVRAAVFSATAVPSANAGKGIDQVFHILNNFDIPVGVARDVEGGVVHTDYTLLTTARDPQALRYYYKSYDDQTIRMVDLKKFDLDTPGIRTMNTRSTQPVVDMSAQLK